MEVKCPREHCYAPDMPCVNGEPLNECPAWKDSPTGLPQGMEQIDIRTMIPWTGNSLGTADLEYIAARSKPKLIGIIGPFNAGKTTLLTVLYLLLSRGRILKGYNFSGSYTFEGWENLAHWMRWPPSGGGPRFPPHTTSNAEQRPGLLHFALRRTDGVLQDLVFTDAPGEWFRRWAINEKDSGAEGARWIARYADAFALLIDSEELAGEDRGVARNKYFELAQRLASCVGERPVSIVWSKNDILVPSEQQTTMNEYFRRLFPHRKEFRTTVKPSSGWDLEAHEPFLDLFLWLLNTSKLSASRHINLKVTALEDPLIAFRGL